MSKFSIVRRRVLAAGVAFAAVIAYGGMATTNASAFGGGGHDYTTATSVGVSPGSVALSDSVTITATVVDSPSQHSDVPGGSVNFSMYDNPGCTVGQGNHQIYGSSSSVPLDGSGAATLTGTAQSFGASAGKTYYWRASYNADHSHQDSTGGCASMTVLHASSVTVTPQASVPTAGTSATASASVTATNPTGNVVFTLYTDSNCTNATGSPSTKSLSGSGNTKSATSGSISIGSNSTYYWQAAYQGDSNNASSKSSCVSMAVKPAVKTTPTLTLNNPTAKATYGDSASASAQLSSGTSPTGTITINLYGPNDASCTGTPLSGTKTVSGNGAYGPVTVTPAGAGTYHWTASYSGDSQNNAVTAPSTGCGPALTVSQASATISGSTTSPIQFGDALPVVNATVKGVAGGGTPTGSVTFTLYSDTNCATSLTTITESLDGSGKASTTGGEVSSLQIGTYYWRASYGGDGNYNGAATNCQQYSHSISLQVNKATTTLSWSTPANIAYGTPLSATQLNATATDHNGQTVAGTMTYSIVIGGTGTVTDGHVLDAGWYYLQAAFKPSDTTDYTTPWPVYVWLDVTQYTPSVTVNPTPATATYGTPLSASVTVAGQSGADKPTGWVEFKLYDNDTCSGQSLFHDWEQLQSDGTASSASYSNAALGTYYWVVKYADDSNYTSTVSGCAAASVTVGKAQPTISVTPASSTATYGDGLTASATLSGGVTPSGTVTVKLYTEPTCTQTAVYTYTDNNVSGDGTFSTGSYTALAPGTYYWRASYGGDTDNLPATSDCNAASVVVGQAASSVTVKAASSSVTYGDNLSAKATVSGVAGGSTPGGTVDFALYQPGDPCTGTPVYTEKGVTLAADGTADSGTFPSAAVGTYHWAVHYNGDTNYAASDSGCTAPVDVTGTATSVVTPPSDTTVTAGDTATFTASATGNPTPQVAKWEVSTDGGSNWTALASGWTDSNGSSTLTLAGVTASMNGYQYRVTFTNPLGDDTSKAATLTVQEAPIIVQQPQDTSVAAGSDASFTAAAVGLPNPTVQWQSCPSTADCTTPGGWSDVAGATSTTLSLTAVAPDADGSQYRAVFTNLLGSTFTDPATLTVTTPAPVDLPGSLPGSDGDLTGVPGTTTPGETFTATGTGFAPYAPVTFGIYSSPTTLAHVSADASGTASASITIPADFSGDHTVVAAGTGALGSPQFLEAGTTVVVSSTVTPGGSGSNGVGGVSTSRGAPGPNGGSSSGLANTGTRENPIALAQLALLVMLAGAGLLVIGRRRQARKH